VKVLRGVSSIPRERDYVLRKVSELLEEWSRIEAECKHRNICAFYGCVQGWGQLPSPVIPYFKNGNVVKYVKDHPDADRMTLLVDIATGLAWLHTQSIVHGNLKASNVLIQDDGVACLSDIQLSSITSTTHFTTAGIAGGARHIAPEIMNPPDDEDEEEDGVKHTTKSDVYSFAMTSLEILTGQPPFHNIKLDSVVIAKVVKGTRPERPEVSQVDDALWNLLTRCWDQDPKCRPSIAEVLKTLTAARPGPSSYLVILRERFRAGLAIFFVYFRQIIFCILPRRWLA